MRLKNLIIGDVKFQYKYGFYMVYAILSIVYISVIYALPHMWREKAAAVMVFSDPAAMGLFFMGAIILLEKSDRVLNSIAVSPVKVSEYIFSKVFSLCFISTTVGLLIAMSAKSSALLTVMIGTSLGSAFFTLIGLIVASNISSLNQFLVATVPVEIISCLPPILYLFGYKKAFMLVHPGCIIIRLISGNGDNLFLLTAVLCAWIGLMYIAAYKYIEIMFQRVGGVKL